MKQAILRKFLPLLIIAGAVPLLTWTSPLPASAASLQLGSSVQSRLDAALEGADTPSKSNIQQQYSKLVQLQRQDTDWEARTKSIQNQNESAIHNVRTRMKELDRVKIEKLDTQARQTRQRYQPLFTLHSTLNQQAKSARTKGDKELAKKLASRASDLQLAVQLARQDIKLKDNALKAAKTAKSRSAAAIRKILSETDAVKIQMKQSRNAISTTKKSLSTEWKSFNQRVKSKDTTGISRSLATLNAQSQQIVSLRQQLFQLEQKNSSIIAKAMALLPK
ncbi:hypothetical protein [Paenibacillus pinihumi]|uniref:hypothetical protein n=1 Tax=Paenibacillus pinihumi TaxID=669462 RepID=UPI0003F5A09A|nr:hypothetical protein [Paenibacillus pinihumi]